jgi:predicted nucleic acid-binding protein
VLVRKSGWSGEQARAAILTWRDAFSLAPTTGAAMLAAADLAADRRLGIWDSLMVAVAAEGDCRLLLSEDMQDGFSWRGVTVVNPFAAKRHPLLDALLDEAGGAEP